MSKSIFNVNMEAPAIGTPIVEKMEEYMFSSGEEDSHDEEDYYSDDSSDSSDSNDDYLNCIDCDRKTYREYCRNRRCEDCHAEYYSICRKDGWGKCECSDCIYKREKDDPKGVCKMCKSFSHKFYISADVSQEIALCYTCIHQCVIHGIANEDFHPLFLSAAKKITNLKLFISLGLQIKEITNLSNPISCLPPEIIEIIIKEVIHDNHNPCVKLSYMRYEYVSLELSPTKVDLFYAGINLADYSKNGYFYVKIEHDLPAIIWASGPHDWYKFGKQHKIELNGDEENLLTFNKDNVSNIVNNHITNTKNYIQCLNNNSYNHLSNNYKSYYTNNRKNNWRR
jgi:hypothetical protein